MEETYIKIFHRILNWEWYDDRDVRDVFYHLLLRASLSDTRWHGIELKRGQLVTSYAQLASEVGMSVRNARTSLAKLIDTGEVTKQVTKQVTILTICKYDSYQGFENTSDKPTDKEVTRLRQGCDKPQLNANQEVIGVLEQGTDKTGTFSDINIDIHSTCIEKEIYKEKEKEKEKEKKKSKVEIQAEMEKRKQDFYNSLIPHVEEFGKEMVREFYDYWTEPNKSGTKFRKESESHWDLHRRLLTWQRNNDKNSKQYDNSRTTTYDRRRGLGATAKPEDYTPL